MSSFDQVAEQFVKFYYPALITNPTALAAVYRDHSMLSYETECILGAAAIVEKFSNLNLGAQTQFRKDYIDAQPVGDDGVLFMVTGAFLIEGQVRPLTFSQTFQLRTDGPNSWWVLNDIFRLVYPAE